MLWGKKREGLFFGGERERERDQLAWVESSVEREDRNKEWKK